MSKHNWPVQYYEERPCLTVLIFKKYHRAQWSSIGDTFIVAGGAGGTQSSEKCTLNENGEFICVDITPQLNDYYYGVSFNVLEAYCNYF